ncbi:MAG: hypothetical protein ABEJ58_05605 [Halodesulfurarchaeum sp.]
MRVRANGVEHRGQALDLRGTGIEVRDLFQWLRDETDDRIQSPTGGPLHQQVGWIKPSMTLDVRRALANAARSLGRMPPQQEHIDRLDARIEAISPTFPDLERARKRVARTGEELDGHRERVARLSGRLEEQRVRGAVERELEDSVSAAIRRLSEVETEAIAARQALDDALDRARRARDRQETRLSLVDRRENLKREARAWLLEAVWPQFLRAIRSLPPEVLESVPLDYGRSVPLEGVRSTGGTSENRNALDRSMNRRESRPNTSKAENRRTMVRPSDFTETPVPTACAIVRIARMHTPVLLAVDCFDRAVRARAALDAPVILV